MASKIVLSLGAGKVPEMEKLSLNFLFLKFLREHIASSQENISQCVLFAGSKWNNNQTAKLHQKTTACWYVDNDTDNYSVRNGFI